MIRLTAHKKMRISNRLAFFAALMLVISALAGMNKPHLSGQDEHGWAADNSSPRTYQATTSSTATNSEQGNKGFIMSLFLIRGS
jgi:hypothetical protein